MYLYKRAIMFMLHVHIYIYIYIYICILTYNSGLLALITHICSHFAHLTSHALMRAKLIQLVLRHYSFLTNIFFLLTPAPPFPSIMALRAQIFPC